jgi:amidase
MKNLYSYSARQAAAAIASKQVSSVELVQDCLARISEREGAIRAWAYLDEELALKQAQARDSEPHYGPPHGVPIGVKDNIDTVCMPTAYGSSIYEGHRPAREAACISLLRRAGAVIMGKTTTTEFALYEPSKTENPHAPTHTPGGSSSGSAAAVADLHVPAALGTQTSGSLIRPTAYCA